MSKINDIDQEIEVLERLLANANERRREEVNRTDANKVKLRVGYQFAADKSIEMKVHGIEPFCDHTFKHHGMSGRATCTKCNAEITLPEIWAAKDPL